MPKLAESLAGRMEILRLHPLAQCELAGRAPRFLDVLFAGDFKTRKVERLGNALVERVAAGGYPAPLARQGPRRRAVWYRGYIEALVQRDVRELARIRSLDAMPRLLELAAAQTARLVNLSELSGPFQLSRPTIREYVTLLERVFLVEELPPWHVSRGSRLVKTPKLHLGDTGLACALLGVSMNQEVVVRVFDIVGGPLCVSADDDQTVHDKIAPLLREGRKILVSFERIEWNALHKNTYPNFNKFRQSTSFSSIGQNAALFAREILKRKIGVALEA